MDPTVTDAEIDRIFQAYLGHGADFGDPSVQAHRYNPGGAAGVGAAVADSAEHRDGIASGRLVMNDAGTGVIVRVDPASTTTPTPTPTPTPPPNPNPFGSSNPSDATAEDPAVYAMIQSQTPIWLARLKTFASKLNFGNPDQAAQDELNGMLTALRTSANQTRAGNTRAITPETLIGQAEARLTARGRVTPGGATNVPGGGTTNTTTTNPNTTNTTTTTNPNTANNAVTAPAANTMANIVNTPTMPYSARAALPAAVTPFATQTAASTSMRPAAMAQPSTAFQPRAFQQTMQGILQPTGTPSAPSDPAAENAWNRTNAQYRQAGNAYMAAQGDQMGQTYNPSPWSGTRLVAPRTALGQPEAMGSPNDVALASEADRRRAYRFGQQNAQANQANTALGQQDFNGQMNNWLKAYNDWNNRGVDPTGGM